MQPAVLKFCHIRRRQFSTEWRNAEEIQLRDNSVVDEK